MRTTIEVDQAGMIRIKDMDLDPTNAGEERNPIMLGPEHTLECIRSELLGPTILVSDGEGNPLYGVNVRRSGMYILDECGHTYTKVEIPAREPTLA